MMIVMFVMMMMMIMMTIIKMMTMMIMLILIISNSSGDEGGWVTKGCAATLVFQVRQQMLLFWGFVFSFWSTTVFHYFGDSLFEM